MTQKANRSATMLLVVLAVASAYSPVSIDFFAPFMPGVTRELGWSMLEFQVSIYSFFMGYGLAPFAWGGLADHYGRRRVMLIGLGLYCIATVCCMLTTNIALFTLARFVQGAGAATGVVLSRVILRDIHGPHGATKAISGMYLIMVWVPMVLPLLGGYMAFKYSWQSGFGFMLFLGLMTLAASYYLLMETFPSTMSTRPRGMARWRGILSNRIFLQNALANMFSVSVMLLFLSNYAYITEQLYHFTSKQNGYVLAVFNASIAAGVYLVRAVVPRIGIRPTIYTGVWMLVVAWTFNWVLILSGNPVPGLLVVPILLGCIGTGMVITLTTGQALIPFSNNTGAAAAMFVFVQSSGAAAISYLAGRLMGGSMFSVSLAMWLCALLAAASCFILRYRGPRNDVTEEKVQEAGK